ncbi:hypothetical protein TNCV_3686221 [Trichonephila clavipes]|nr:hypothetical protein TNCV_3686221 [Trichonephila clavipes]
MTESCVSLLSRYKNDPFLTRIVTEKRVMYRNLQRRRTVCRPSNPPASTSKAGFHRKMLLSVCGNIGGIIPWKVLPLNQTVNAAFYCLPSTAARR